MSSTRGLDSFPRFTVTDDLWESVLQKTFFEGPSLNPDIVPVFEESDSLLESPMAADDADSFMEDSSEDDLSNESEAPEPSSIDQHQGDGDSVGDYWFDEDWGEGFQSSTPASAEDFFTGYDDPENFDSSFDV